MSTPLLNKQTKTGRGPSLVHRQATVFGPCSGQMMLLIDRYQRFKPGAATLCSTPYFKHCIPLGDGFPIYKSFLFYFFF